MCNSRLVMMVDSLSVQLHGKQIWLPMGINPKNKRKISTKVEIYRIEVKTLGLFNSFFASNLRKVICNIIYTLVITSSPCSQWKTRSNPKLFKIYFVFLDLRFFSELSRDLSKIIITCKREAKKSSTFIWNKKQLFSFGLLKTQHFKTRHLWQCTQKGYTLFLLIF